ncbi:MAG: glycosyltransferase [Candidatus Sericytochromatia bacterium]
MKVLFQARPNLFTSFGGDSVQILKTKEYLEKLGVNIDISTELSPNVEKYDLIHAFNVTTPQDIISCLRAAKQKNKKTLLSTIYVDYTEFERKARGGIAQLLFNIISPNSIQYTKVLLKAIKNRNFNSGILDILKFGYYGAIKETLSLIDIYLPNSYSEMNRMTKDFNLQNASYMVIPNAIDTALFNYNSEYNIKSDIKDCILSVGRIEGRKSHLNLVKAMRDLPYKLVIIGKASPNQKSYYDKVKREAGDNVVFIEHIEHNELPIYYKSAKVHCLISWMETTGLVSLEAGAMGCNLVITDKGDTKEYFEDNAFYCEPDNINSIKNAIKKAYESPVNYDFIKKITEKYNWEITAQKTLEAYNKLLSK